MGHRNPLGLAFDADGQLWEHEMGPKGGDELNRIEAGANHGYPLVSDGDHYDGEPIPDHDTAPEFAAPAISWNPVISPAGLVIYRGEGSAAGEAVAWPEWDGQALDPEACRRNRWCGSRSRRATCARSSASRCRPGCVRWSNMLTARCTCSRIRTVGGC